ncbi:MAG: hypothetical protein ACK4VZ_02885 [Paracoccaceae bacterium]
MNGPGREDILAFVKHRTGRRLTPLHESDVLAALALDGDRAAAFMDSFAAEFSVDLTGYEPQFHYRDTRRLMRPGWPFSPPLLFGVRLPLAISTLAHAARSGCWPLVYPVLPAAPSRQWLNAPLILIGLPLLAALVIAAVRWL